LTQAGTFGCRLRFAAAVGGTRRRRGRRNSLRWIYPLSCDPVLRRGDSLQHAFDALGREVELDEGDAAIESFAVIRDQSVAKMEAAHAFEEDGAPVGFRQQESITEAETRISDRPVA